MAEGCNDPHCPHQGQPHVHYDAASGFTVRGALKEYRIERLWENGAEYVAIDGVRCSAEVLESLIVSPRPDVWLRFERKDDLVIVDQMFSEPLPSDPAGRG